MCVFACLPHVPLVRRTVTRNPQVVALEASSCEQLARVQQLEERRHGLELQFLGAEAALAQAHAAGATAAKAAAAAAAEALQAERERADGRVAELEAELQRALGGARQAAAQEEQRRALELQLAEEEQHGQQLGGPRERRPRAMAASEGGMRLLKPAANGPRQATWAGDGGAWQQEALLMLSEHDHDGVPAGATAFVTASRSCSVGGNWDEATPPKAAAPGLWSPRAAGDAQRAALLQREQLVQLQVGPAPVRGEGWVRPGKPVWAASFKCR